MRRALALALKGRFGAHPNPLVGAVVVKDGRVVGEGFHARFGGPHAEAAALRAAGPRASGAELHVTLEPCSTFGKTPPCCDAIVKAGVRKVVFGASDPSPANGGRARRLLRAAGIEVVSGVLARDCRGLNAPFEKLMRTGAPYVTMKIAQSLDGRITPAPGGTRWISGLESRRLGHELRAEADAVVTGVGTVAADDPLLNVRHVRSVRDPARVVLDPRLRIPLGCRVVATAGRIRTIVACLEGAPARRRRALERAGVSVRSIPGAGPRIPLKALLRDLGSLGMAHVLVEAGTRVNGAFLREGLVDRLVLFVAPTLIGGDHALPAFSGASSGGPWPSARRLRIVRLDRAGDDVLIEGTFDVHRDR